MDRDGPGEVVLVRPTAVGYPWLRLEGLARSAMGERRAVGGCCPSHAQACTSPRGGGLTQRRPLPRVVTPSPPEAWRDLVPTAPYPPRRLSRCWTASDGR